MENLVGNTPDENFDAKLLLELLKGGHKRIDKYCHNAVLIIGATGEGKSTLCSAFGGY